MLGWQMGVSKTMVGGLRGYVGGRVMLRAQRPPAAWLVGLVWWEGGGWLAFVGGAFDAFHDGAPVHNVVVVYGPERDEGGIGVGLVGF